MDTIFMNSENSKKNLIFIDCHTILQIKKNLKRSDKYVGLSNLSHTKNYRLKISAPTQNEEFELPDGSYSASDIQDYFEYILKKNIRLITLQDECT